MAHLGVENSLDLCLVISGLRSDGVLRVPLGLPRFQLAVALVLSELDQRVVILYFFLLLKELLHTMAVLGPDLRPGVPAAF